MNRTDELRTARIDSLVTPADLQDLPITVAIADNVTASRKRIARIWMEKSSSRRTNAAR